MSEPPSTPRPPDDGRQPSGEPAPRTPAASDPPAAPEATPERPPPYQGTYGALPGQAPPPPAAGYGRPGHGPPAQPGHAQPGQPYPGPGGPQDMLAGRGARLGAGLLDGLILGVVSLPAVLFAIRWDKMQASLESGEPIVDPLALYDLPRLMAANAVTLLVGFAYFTIMHVKWGQTIGKKAAGIRLVTAADQSAVSWGQVIGRQAFVFVVSVTTAMVNFFVAGGALLAMLGLLDNAWILWDERRQAVHDKVAGTLVVKAVPWVPNPYART